MQQYNRDGVVVPSAAVEHTATLLECNVRLEGFHDCQMCQSSVLAPAATPIVGIP